MNAANSNKFWTALRDALPLAALDADIWRISTAPAEGARVVGLSRGWRSAQELVLRLGRRACLARGRPGSGLP